MNSKYDVVPSRFFCLSGANYTLSFQFSSVAQLCLFDPMDFNMTGSLSITNSLSLLKLMSIESVMPFNHFILCHPLLLLHSIFPSFRVFSMSRLFTSGGQTIGASASASVLPMNSQGQFPLGLIGLISFMSKGPSRVFSNTTVRKHQFFSAQSSLWADSHIHTWLLEKQFWLDRPLLEKWCLCFLNTLSRFVIAFLRRSSIF